MEQMTITAKVQIAATDADKVSPCIFHILTSSYT